jgi:hypothetical protein
MLQRQLNCRLGKKRTRTDSKQRGVKHYHCLYRTMEAGCLHSCHRHRSSLQQPRPCHGRRRPRYHRTRGESSRHSAGSSSCHRQRTRHREPWHHSPQHTSSERTVSNARCGNRIGLEKEEVIRCSTTQEEGTYHRCCNSFRGHMGCWRCSHPCRENRSPSRCHRSGCGCSSRRSRRQEQRPQLRSAEHRSMSG